jgi:hypothetical protein
MKRLLALAVLFSALSVSASYARDEVPGRTRQIAVAIPAGGFNCGRDSWPLYCYGIPFKVGGTAWLYDRYPGVPGLSGDGTGFILFTGVLDLGEATITSAVPVLNSQNFLTSITVTFNGSTNDGDGDTYSGTGTFTFTYVYEQGGGGKGGGSSGYYQFMQSGKLSITYQ